MSEARCFRSTLSARGNARQSESGDTSLALPAEASMAEWREPAPDRSARVQQQVQLTLARRSRMATSSGNIYSLDPVVGSGRGHQYSVMAQAPSHLRSVGMHSLKRLTHKVEVSPTSSPVLSQLTLFGSQTSGTGCQGAYTLPARSYKRYAHSEMLLSQKAQAPPRENQNGGSQHGSYKGHHKSLSGKPDALSFLTAVRENGRGHGSKQDSCVASLASIELDGLVGSTPAVVKLGNQNGVHVMNGRRRLAQASEMTLERAVNQLSHTDTDTQLISVYYIQHQCFTNPACRKMLLCLNGIPKLLDLLESDSEELQKASVGALRNATFESSENKMVVRDNKGIESLIGLLKTTRDIETRKQLTGVLWNLSSNDLLKDHICTVALRTLTDAVIIPCSGIAEGDDPKRDLLVHPDIFYNATGCLRNLSSAGPDTRIAMRQCDGLIDALVHYVQGTIADHKPDDQSTENCVCILHNLSYQMDAEVPQSQPPPLSSEQSPPRRIKTLGCFGSRSKAIVHKVELPPQTQKKTPQGKDWLWSPAVVRTYLSLLACSKRRYTQEAATGALLNATAGRGMMQQTMAQAVVQENGLPQVKKMLTGSEPDVRRAALSLLKNISRYRELHNQLVNQVLPELIAMLPNSGSGKEVPHESTVLLCGILTDLSQSESQHARAIANQGGLGKILNISTIHDGFGSSRSSEAASALLHTMWQHRDLRPAYSKARYKKIDFINNRTVKAVSSAQDDTVDGMPKN